MKKLLKIFLIILTVITILPTRIWAEESEENIVIDFSTNNYLWGLSYMQIFGLTTLEDNGVLKRENDYITNSEGKKLLIEDNEKRTIEVVDGVGEADNIEYTITSEDKEKSKGLLQPYNKIIVKFGKNDHNETDFVIEIEEGKKIMELPVLFIEDGGGMLDLIKKGVFKGAQELTIENINGKHLFTGNYLLDKSPIEISDHNCENNIPYNVTEEDDVIYIVTDESRAKSVEIFGRDIFGSDIFDGGYNKIILNFSGRDYSNEATTTKIYNMNEYNFYIEGNNILAFFGYENIISSVIKVKIQSIEGKTLAYYSTSMIDAYSRNGIVSQLNIAFKIPDDVGEDDTIIYELDDELKQIFPDNYQRLVIKFRKKAKENPVIPINDIIENPKTFNNILIVLGIIIMVIIGTTLPKLKDNK